MKLTPDWVHAHRADRVKAYNAELHRLLGSAAASCDSSPMPTDARALLALLRDTTNSRDIHARCVALIGEATP